MPSVKKQGIRPQVIIEPTCGKGHFILAALQTFDNIEEIYGIEIYKPYLQTLKLDILQHYLDHPQASKSTIHLLHRNFLILISNLSKHPSKERIYWS